MFLWFCMDTLFVQGARGGAVGWGTALKARRSRVSIPDGVIGIFHWHNPSGRTMTGLDTACNGNEYKEYFLGVKAAGA
jgi:hypothetical protein